MNPENRWIRLAELIPWDEYEEKYASRFMSDTGNVAKPCRMALGALIIQKRLGFSDRELVEEITENPYLQYFIGLPGYQNKGVRHCVGIVNKFPERCGKAAFFQNRALIS